MRILASLVLLESPLQRKANIKLLEQMSKTECALDGSAIPLSYEKKNEIKKYLEELIIRRFLKRVKDPKIYESNDSNGREGTLDISQRVSKMLQKTLREAREGLDEV